MKIGFAIITKKPFFDEIIRIENEVHKVCGFHTRLQSIFNVPHTTLFQGSFRDDVDYEKIIHSIKKFYVEITKSFCFDFDKVVYVPKGWYFYCCQNTDNLKRLHTYTLSLCKPYIVLDPDRLKEDVSYLPEDQIAGIKEYGYRYSGQAFFPHITLGRNDEDKREDLLDLLNNKLSVLSENIPIEKFTVYEMGKDGTHRETLAEVTVDNRITFS